MKEGCQLPKSYCKVQDLATLKLYLDKHANTMESACTGDVYCKPSLLSHTLRTSEQPYCAVIMLLSTPRAKYLVKQNENDIDNFWRTFCEVKSLECLDKIFKNVIVDNHISIPKHFLQLIPKGMTSFPCPELDFPFFLERGADPNVVIGENGSNFLEEHFFELSDECIGAFLDHGARLDRSRLKGADNTNGNNSDLSGSSDGEENNIIRKRKSKKEKVNNSADVAHRAHAMLEYVRRRSFDVRPLVEQGPILHNMVINITPHVSFPLTKLFARQGAHINKLEHLYRILYATLNNYAECEGKKHDEVKQILHFLVKPKDFTYFLPACKRAPITANPLTSLPVCVLNQMFSHVCERLYDVINLMLVCKTFHNLFFTDLSDPIWFNVSAVAPLFLNPGKDSRKSQPGKCSSNSANGICKRGQKFEEIEELILNRDQFINSRGEDGDDDSDDEDREEDDDDEDEEDEEEEMEYDSDDSEPDHMNSDLNPNDCFSDYWSSMDFALHSDCQNVLLRAIRCKAPAYVIKALLASPDNKNFVDDFLRNPVHWCAINDTQNVEVLRELLLAGIPHDKPDKFLRTPLHYALLRGKSEIAEMLASFKPPDSASRGLRTSFDPAIQKLNKPNYETPPDLNNFLPSSRLVEDEQLLDIITTKTPKITKKKINRQCYLPSKCSNYPKRFMKMDTCTSMLPMGGAMLYSRSHTPFVDLVDASTFWTQRHIGHPALTNSILCDSPLSDSVFLTGSKSLGVWDVRVPNFLVNLTSLPGVVSSFGRTNEKIGYTCGGNAYYTDLRSDSVVEIGKCAQDIEAVYANDKMFWMTSSPQAKHDISVYDLKTLSRLAPLKGVDVDDLDPHDRRVMLAANDQTLTCCVLDRVFSCDLSHCDDSRMRLICEVPGVATALAIDNQSKHVAVGGMGLSGVFLHDANKFCTPGSGGECEISSTTPTCFPMSHDDHSCHIDDECSPRKIRLHLGAVWSATSCGRISVVPNFYN